MKQAIIFANGRMEVPPHFQPAIHSSILIIAADGGTHNSQALGIQPNLIIGDLDSMDSEEINAYRLAGINIIQFPSHKNETDLELALHYCVKNGIDEVFILGGLGARLDMTISNILLIANPAFNSMKVRFIDGNQELRLLRAKTSYLIEGNEGDTVSLIPINGDASGITTNGLEYPLMDESLLFGQARGVSNVLIQENAQIFFKKGLLICTTIKGADHSSIE